MSWLQSPKKERDTEKEIDKEKEIHRQRHIYRQRDKEKLEEMYSKSVFLAFAFKYFAHTKASDKLC